MSNYTHLHQWTKFCVYACLCLRCVVAVVPDANLHICCVKLIMSESSFSHLHTCLCTELQINKSVEDKHVNLTAFWPGPTQQQHNEDVIHDGQYFHHLYPTLFASAVAKYLFKHQEEIVCSNSHLTCQRNIKPKKRFHIPLQAVDFLKSWLKIKEWSVVRLEQTTETLGIPACEL